MHVVDVIGDLLVRLGTTWVLWLLFLLFVTGAVVAVERWVYFRSKNGDVHAIATALDASLSRRNIKAALRTLRPLQSVGAIVARAGLRLAPRGARAAEKGMHGAISVERKALAARLVYLGGLRVGAPLVGAFGTVVAAILALAELGRSSPANQLGLAFIAAALARALVSTAVGLGVALPAVAAHAYFQRRTAEFLDDADTVSNLVLAYLTTRTPSPLVHSSGRSGRGTDDKSGSRKRPSPEAA
jgi:biopolymer transport protein ExbB